MSETEKENPTTEAKQECKDITDNKRPHKRARMELLIQVATALAIFGGIAITLATYYHKQSLIVWSVYYTIIMVLLVPFLYWQKRILERPVSATAALAKSPASTPEPVTTAEDYVPFLDREETITVSSKGGEKVPVTVIGRVMWDVPNQAVTVSYFVSESPHTLEVCAVLPDRVKGLLDYTEKLRVKGEQTYQGERPMQIQTARFTGRVFIYHQSYLLSDEIDELTTFFKKKNLTPHFRHSPIQVTPSGSKTPKQKSL